MTTGGNVNRRLRLTALGLLVAVMSVLALLPASGAQAATATPASFVGWGPITNYAAKSCVDVRSEDGPYSWGAHVQIYHCTGVDEQQWYPAGVDGGYNIINKKSNLCLDGGEFWARQWGCNGSPQQLWQVVWQAGFPSATYQLRNGNGLCLVLTGGNGKDHQLLSDDTCGTGYPYWWNFG
jgi:hypothetical protein